MSRIRRRSGSAWQQLSVAVLEPVRCITSKSPSTYRIGSPYLRVTIIWIGASARWLIVVSVCGCAAIISQPLGRSDQQRIRWQSISFSRAFTLVNLYTAGTCFNNKDMCITQERHLAVSHTPRFTARIVGMMNTWCASSSYPAPYLCVSFSILRQHHIERSMGIQVRKNTCTCWTNTNRNLCIASTVIPYIQDAPIQDFFFLLSFVGFEKRDSDWPSNRIN